MTILAAVAFVTTTIQAIKKLWVTLEGKVALILTLALCAGVTGYKCILEALPFDLLTLWFFAQVVIGALGGYEFFKLLKKNDNNTVAPK